MLELEQLLNALQSSGPWGWVLAAVIVAISTWRSGVKLPWPLGGSASTPATKVQALAEAPPPAGGSTAEVLMQRLNDASAAVATETDRLKGELRKLAGVVTTN